MFYFPKPDATNLEQVGERMSIKSLHTFRQLPDLIYLLYAWSGTDKINGSISVVFVVV